MTKEGKVNARGMKEYYVRDLIVREDIMDRAKELAAMIASTDEVKMYQQAEKRIQEHEKIQQLIRLIKKKQKEVVAFESFENEQMVKKIEGEIKELQEELDAIPLVQQFQQTQSDINYMLQMILNVIRDSLSELISLDQSDGENLHERSN